MALMIDNHKRTPMNSPSTIGAAVIGVILIAISVYIDFLLNMQNHSESDQVSAASVHPGPIDRASQTTSNIAGIKETDPAHSLLSMAIPEWERLDAMSEDDQEIYLTRIIEEPSWSEDMRRFLMPKLSDKKLSPVARNNLAIGLLRNNVSIGVMESEMLIAVDDITENPLWREYAVQFLAVCIEHGGASPKAEGKIRQIFNEDKDSRAITAALQLQRLEEKKMIETDPYFDIAVVMRASNPACNGAMRATLLGIIALKKLKQGRAVALTAISSTDVTVRRAAFAALGDIGESEDLVALHQGMEDESQLVVRAAKVAIDKLQRKN
jgi:hypothetical protein